MRYGDKDGYNEIYDSNGELILHPNEKALVVEENVVPTFKSTWRYYGGDYLLEASKGTIYLTNERLIFINIPERMFAIGGDEARAVSTDMDRSLEFSNLSAGATTREYFEVPNIEMMASEKKEGAVSLGEMVNLYILSSGNQYHISMVLPSDSDLLKRLMNKRVGNLDQLVNNLKDYFQKDDWMFTEAEKSIYLKPQEKEPLTGPSLSAGVTDEEEGTGASTPPQIEPQPFDPTIPARRLRDGPGEGSVAYFQTLYRKGLIRDDIYRRLMEQYGIPPETGLERINDTGPSAKTGEDLSREGPSPDDAAPQETDEELLTMLNETLSDFSDESEEITPAVEDNKTQPAAEDEQE
ncbi:MAG: hypothetical protein JW939_09705 [Candidatus Thermoplasmatota archaeon]|nr:hypothetical protein [Candidatus Thermoplasmatota archaeon]